MPTLETGDGRVLAWHEAGSGPPLLCHPGGPGLSSDYYDGLPELAAQRTLLLLDPRGTGASDRPADGCAYRIEDYAADLEALRAALGIERLDVFGHSFGGVVAMAWAAAQPERAGRLVLANTLARVCPEGEEDIEAAMAARSGEPWYEDALAASDAEDANEFADDFELAGLFARELPFYFPSWGDEEAAYAARIAADAFNADALRLWNSEIWGRFDLRPGLTRIASSALVITGELDFLTGPSVAREIADSIPRARLVLLPGAGHFPFAESAARAPFSEAVLAFLE